MAICGIGLTVADDEHAAWDAQASPPPGVSVPVFVTAPVAPVPIVALTVTATLPLAGTAHVVDTLPVPLAGVQPAAVQDWNVTPAGAASAISAGCEALGVALLAVNVYVTVVDDPST